LEWRSVVRPGGLLPCS